jgi:hypothetical protein
MQFQIPSIPRVLVILPLLAVGLVAASAVVYIRLDNIVHTDLYRFELEFNSDWAVKYWANSWLILGSLAVAASFEFFSALYLLASYSAKIAPNRSTVVLLLLISVCAAVISVVLFTTLEKIVHGDLYQFGLQFSEEWAIPYRVNGQLFLGLTGLSVILDCASLVFTVRIWPIMSIARERLIVWLLLPAGGVVLFIAFAYESAISAFIGLGFILWSLVILYAGSERYVEESVLAALIVPPLANLDRLLADLDCRGKAFFLPPEFLSDFESCRAYISVEKSSDPPKPEHIRGKENGVLLKEPPGVIIEPPGANLTKLLESKLGTRFTRVDLQFLQGQLPKIFVEKLQLAKSLEVTVEKGRALVAIGDFALKGMYEKISTLAHVYSEVGSPAASAIGCALAKSSGRLVSVENEAVSRDGRNVSIEYRIWRSLPGEN